MQTIVSPSLHPSHGNPGHPLKLVVLGDSLIYGFGDPEGGGWVERLRRQCMLPESSGHVLYNLGVRGDGVKQVNIQGSENQVTSKNKNCKILSPLWKTNSLIPNLNI